MTVLVRVVVLVAVAAVVTMVCTPVGFALVTAAHALALPARPPCPRPSSPATCWACENTSVTSART